MTPKNAPPRARARTAPTAAAARDAGAEQRTTRSNRPSENRRLGEILRPSISSAAPAFSPRSGNLPGSTRASLRRRARAFFLALSPHAQRSTRREVPHAHSPSGDSSRRVFRGDAQRTSPIEATRLILLPPKGKCCAPCFGPRAAPRWCVPWTTARVQLGRLVLSRAVGSAASFARARRALEGSAPVPDLDDRAISPIVGARQPKQPERQIRRSGTPAARRRAPPPRLRARFFARSL